MLHNYFKLAIRNIMKYKFFSAINILGMSIGIAARRSGNRTLYGCFNKADPGAGRKVWLLHDPITDIHLKSQSQHDLEPGGNIMYVYFFAGIGIFIILIACINFMNLSTARSAGRAKEVGLRKTFGSLRGQMVGQFLAESILYSFIAVMFSLILCYFLLPHFNLLAGKQLDMVVFGSPVFIISILTLIIFVGVIAGSYPAFYLTSFNAVEVLKGKVRFPFRLHRYFIE